MTQVLPQFHPAVRDWFTGRFAGPSEPQLAAWPSIKDGRNTLIAAPTGSGKTLAAFLAAIDDLVRASASGPLPDTLQVVYVSPLKALSNDIRVNLEEPLSGIDAALEHRGLPPTGIRTMVRTGDTPTAERTAMTRRPPHILVTTPESLFILLTSEGGRRTLRTARTVIVDEIHAVADDKRGSHLALSLERLDQLVRADGGRLLRIGLSATQRPIERVARFLVGAGHLRDDGTADCTIVETGRKRSLDLALELPSSPLGAVMETEVWDEIYDRLVQLIEAHRTTLIFVNTRRVAERVTRHLSERIGEGKVATHHGSLSREQRFSAEQRLKSGKLRVLTATASLELGIDIGSVDLVCTLGSTRSIATLVQRVGRSGHFLGGTPRGRIFPTSRDELIECIALLDAVRRDELEELIIPRQPLDILAQQIVAAVACEEWSEDALFDLVRRADPFRELARADFDAVVTMLAHGFATRRGRRGALVHHDAVHGKLRARRGARLAAITSGGAIPETGDVRVILQPAGTFVGTLNEDFAIESLPGDIFQLGNASWRIQRIEQGRVLVEDASGQPPTIPFWLGEAPGRSDELSLAVSRLREQIDLRLQHGADAAIDWLVEDVGIGPSAAEQAVGYLAATRAALGAMPSQRTLVLERFFDEAGDQHVVIHAPFGSRLNRAWGLALRKRFCQSFNFELQAAANEDAIVLSLGPTHSYPAADTFAFLRAATVRDSLIQALLDAPMFPVRWRWNASRALALLRWRGGRRVPPPLQRMQAEDLIAVVFPDQLACLENIVGKREIPEHPLVQQTIRDCLEEAMDIERLEALLGRIERGEIELIVRELREPSPMAHEILNARPYAFLDDAPLEERRTRAVQTRRWIDPQTASDLGRLDAVAIERVRDEAWPAVAGADELHDALLTAGCLTDAEGRVGGRSGQSAAAGAAGWSAFLQPLIDDRRATRLRLPGEPERVLWVAVERLPEWLALYPASEARPAVDVPARLAQRDWSAEAALVEIVRGRLQVLGPVTAGSVAADLGVSTLAVAAALAALESEGFAMQGVFSEPPSPAIDWCERGLLARIHRYTLRRLRREIEPVSQTVFMRFLAAWQRAEPADRAEGADSVAQLLDQLQGFEVQAVAWESDILPARMKRYDPAWLDALCLSGRVVWGRSSLPNGTPGGGSKPIRTTPITLVARGDRAAWRDRSSAGTDLDGVLSAAGRTVLQALRERGACFFDEIVQESGLLRTQVEQALGELVAIGAATADSFAGLRALLTPSDRRPAIGVGSRRGSTAVFGMANAGRWSLLTGPGSRDPDIPLSAEQLDLVARALLRRYGVVSRRVLLRESLGPSWGELLRVFRRLEARGEIRGGRFVDGFTGEQFALPDAVGRLRAVRNDAPSGEMFSISAADPLNLIGIITPGRRVPAIAANRILLRDGEPLAVYEGGAVHYLIEMTPAQQWECRNTLLRRRVPPELRAYLGRRPA